MCKLTNVLEPLLDVPDVVALEQKIAQEGTPLATLMQRAGASLYAALDARILPPEPVVVLVGSGNNGGDGWVVANKLVKAGYPTTLVTTHAASDIKAQPAHDTAVQIASVLAENPLFTVLLNPSEDELDAALSEAHCVIDAILGTGFSGTEVREPYATFIRKANEAHTKSDVFALAADVPSGLSAQTGTAATPTFEADATVTMLAAKPGLVAEGASAYTGTVWLAPLGMDAKQH